jgi:sugar phosphate permease
MRPFKATNVVLALLCAMYFLTYVDRVNLSAAAGAIQDEFGVTNAETGIIFSAFGWAYLIMQFSGAWVGDHFGPRRTLVVCGIIWAGATVLTGLTWGLTALFLLRLLLGIGEGATFPTATRAMRVWLPPSWYGFGQGITHSFSRLGNTVTPPIVLFLIAYIGWRGSFLIVGLISLLWVVLWGWYFRDNPKDHPSITEEELAELPEYDAAPKDRPRVPWWALVRRMWPVTLTYFCYGWCLWIFLFWIPLFFLENYGLDLRGTAVSATIVFFGGFVGDTVGGMLSDAVYRRTGDTKVARLSIIILGFVGTFLSLVPMLFSQELYVAVASLAAAFFFAELIIGPIWAVPMDIAPKYASTASGLMNVGSAGASAISPIVAGYVLDLTGNWELPFLTLMGFCAVGTLLAFTMHPERKFVDPNESKAA